MDESEFEARVNAARAFAESDLPGYKRSLTGWALLGYLAIFGALATVVLLLGGLIGLAVFSTGLFLLLLKKKLIFILLPAVWILLRALWVRIPAPEGYELTRQRVPVLFDEVDQLCRALETTRVNQVLLTPELNAAVVQTPRLGVFGWQRNTLILGLELLLTLPPEQARAVIAHELGHLSGNHSAFNGWIYRVRQSWQRIMQAFSEQDSFGGKLMARFFGWYAPRFEAQSYALAQLNEYEADGVSAELTSPSAAAAALVNVHVTAPYVDEHYWDQFFKQADEQPKPAQLPWMGLRAFVQHDTATGLDDRLRGALERETTIHDTHPSLRDRLAALGVEPFLPSAAGDSAARAWFGDAFDEIIEEFDQLWLASNKTPWERRYHYVRDSRQNLNAFNERSVDDLSEAELWQRALLTEEFAETRDAIDAIIDYRVRCPDDPDGAYLLGRNLFKLDDAKCLTLFDEASRKHSLEVEALRYGYWFLSAQEREAEAKEWLQRFEAALERHNTIVEERQHLSIADTLKETDVNVEPVQAMIAQLKSSKIVKAAWIAEKVFQDNHDGYVGYAIAVKGSGWFLDEDQLHRKLNELMGDFNVWIIPRAGEMKALADHIRKQGSQIV